MLFPTVQIHFSDSKACLIPVGIGPITYSDDNVKLNQSALVSFAQANRGPKIYKNAH